MPHEASGQLLDAALQRAWDDWQFVHGGEITEHPTYADNP